MSGQPTPATLARLFARRMAPLAVAVGLVTAGMPPLLVGALNQARLASESALLAKAVADRLGELAVREPRIWQYNGRKIVLAAAAVDHAGRPVRVRILDCEGDVIHDTHADQRWPSGVQAQAPVLSAGQRVGLVVAAVPTSAAAAAIWSVAAVSSGVGALLAAALFWWPTRVVRSQARQLESAADAVQRAQTQLTEANAALQRRVDEAVAQVRALSSRVLGAHQHERARIARDVHDGVGQSLTALRLDLANAEARGRLPAEVADELQRTLQQVSVELRHVLEDLQPPDLSAGLAPALTRLLERFEERSSILVSMSLEPGDLAGREPAESLYRVVQEALSNVVRHAQASEVSVVVRCTQDPEGISLVVRDDGRGFDAAAGGRRSGLANMEDRVHLGGGRTQITSTPEEGTTVEVWMPTRTGLVSAPSDVADTARDGIQAGPGTR